MSQIKDPLYWKSVDAKAGALEVQPFVEREFPVDASVLEDPLSRRTFLKIMGASIALAGASGCTLNIRKPRQKIRPYAIAPEQLVPGRPVYYATAMSVGLDVAGLLVESHEGRPTKVEGNPQHSMSMGAANAWHQASVLNLYDPDRLKTPLFQTEAATLAQFKKWVLEKSADWRKEKGRGLALLVEENVSPTFQGVLSTFKRDFPEMGIYRYDSVNQDAATEGLSQVFGRPALPLYDFVQANRILSFDADFLGMDLGNLRYAKGFSSRRDPENKAEMNRLYMAESHYSVTGGKADHRFRMSPQAIEGFVIEIAIRVLAKTGGYTDVVSALQTFTGRRQSGLPGVTLSAIADDLLAEGQNSLLVAGSRMPSWAHGVVALVNHALGSVAVQYHAVNGLWDTTGANLASIRSLSSAMRQGAVSTLVMMGGNPAYDTPVDVGFADIMAKVPTSIHFTMHANETSALSTWQVPRSHVLESWGDFTAQDGSVSIGQPLLLPLYSSMSDSAFLALLGGRDMNDFQLVRQQHQSLSDTAWRKVLHNGIVTGPAKELTLQPKSAALVGVFGTIRDAGPKGLQVSFRPDFKVYDGRFANNGWLQELPDPVTKLTWDNAAFVSRATARKLGLDPRAGGVNGPLQAVNDRATPSEVMMAKLTVNGQQMTTAVMVQPGHADDVVTLLFGYGRAMAGRVGKNAGFNVYSVFGGNYTQSGVTLEKVPGTYKVAVTQDHWGMEGRPLYREGSVAEYQENPEFAREMVEHPPLLSSWKEKAYDTGNQWGMTIDLSKCTGCNACLVACQSENNIPIVGKEQVANGREMHWIRLDRYYEGTEDDAVMVQQPVTCMQCENAPCEQVCPVAATVHSSDGLNDMAYNRCVGTKYCSNNCPVKVRRFNFLDYHQRNPQAVAKDRIHLFDYMKEPDKTVQKQFNPNVTVRMRGVMEKCTYCVQRISSTRIVAKNEGRPIQDGEIQTACMQTGPSDAIVFGNILDPESRVSKLKAQHRDYHMLAELNLKPRTSYLAAIRNPNPQLETVERVS